MEVNINMFLSKKNKKHKKRKEKTNNIFKRGFIVENKPKSIIAEAYRTLRTNIQYSHFDKKIKTILVTSAEIGEGKSTVAGNIALAFAQNEKKVILIDCDFRKPSIHEYLQDSNLIGISEVLLEEAILEEVIKKRNDNLYFLTSGKIPQNPSEIIGASVMTKLIEGLKEEYDIVVFDAPALQLFTDAQVLSTKVDGTILVIKSESTKKEVVMEAKKLLDKVGANIIGTVFYGVKDRKRKYYNSYINEE